MCITAAFITNSNKIEKTALPIFINHILFGLTQQLERKQNENVIKKSGRCITHTP